MATLTIDEIPYYYYYYLCNYPLQFNPMSRVALFGFLNLSALLLAIFNAHQLNGTFYAASVYFVESRMSMIVLGSFGIYCMFLTWRVIKDFFLGPLRLIEREVFLFVC